MNTLLVFEAQKALQKLAATPGVISNARDSQALEKNTWLFPIIYPLSAAKACHS